MLLPDNYKANIFLLHMLLDLAALSAIAKTFDGYERERLVSLIENEALLSFDIMIDDYHSNLTK